MYYPNQMKINFLYFLGFILISSNFIYANEDSISVGDVNESLKLIEQIKETYPPEENHYLSVGRSLSLLEAVMEKSEGIPVDNIPVSALDTHFSAAQRPQIKAKLEKQFDIYLKNFMDENAQRVQRGQAPKKLMIMDYAFRGNSMRTLMVMMQDYFKRLHTEVNLEVNYTVVADTSNPYFYANLSEELPAAARGSAVKIIRLDKQKYPNLVEKMKNRTSVYKLFSKYNSWRIAEEELNKEKAEIRPKYNRLVEFVDDSLKYIETRGYSTFLGCIPYRVSAPVLRKK